MTEQETIYQEVCGLLTRLFEIDPQDITPEARLYEDLELDSIDAVDGGILSEILSQKYICGRSLEEIGYLINYSKRQTERLHIKALLKFKPI